MADPGLIKGGGAGTPRVTVIIPTWNRAELVMHAVQSVLAQTARDLEVIVVDDGSTDGTAESLAALPDPRVRLVAIPHTGSPAVARNRGLDEAVGDTVAMLDSDDRWLPTKLERQLAALGDATDRWCHCGYRLVDLQGRPVALRAGHPWEARKGMLLDDVLTGRVTISLGTMLIPRGLIAAAGRLDPALERREDFEYSLRLAALAPAVAVDEVLVEYREHEGRRTRRAPGAHDYAAQSYLRFLRFAGAPRHAGAVARQRAMGHLWRALPGGIGRRSWWAALGLLRPVMM